MRRFSVIPSLAVIGMLVLSGSLAVAKDKGENLEATLSGFEEVPPISTTGHGGFSGKVDAGGTSISYSLNYSDLKGTAAAAYLQFGQRGVNGGILAFLCGGGGKPACPASGTVTGTIVPADILALAGQGIAAGDFVAALRAIRGGVVYANVATSLFPAGEIRGQIGDNKRGDGNDGNDDKGDDDQ